MKTMTDNEIIKALECCSNLLMCDDCPYSAKGCLSKLKVDALAIINRQKAEIERLKTENGKLKSEMSYMINPNTIGDRHEMGGW